MKRVLVMLGVMLFSASAFALNAQAPASEDCNGKKAAFEQHVNSQKQDSFIVQYILINLADPVLKEHRYTEEQFVPLAQCYNTYKVKGTPLVDFVRANADIFRQKAPESVQAVPVYDDLQSELLTFANLVEKQALQAALNEIAARDNDDWVVQHILSNLADPMASMSDEQAAPKAAVYKQLKVKRQPLVEYSLQQAGRFAQYANNVADDLTTFASRVTALAK